jgi:hypothetical protein
MTRQIDRAASPRQYAVFAAVVSAAALALGAATFHAVQKLSKDDCTAVTTTMPDGSQVTTTSCS